MPTTEVQKNTIIILFIQSDFRSQLGQRSSKAETSLEQVIQVTPLGWCQRFAQVEIKGLTAGFVRWCA